MAAAHIANVTIEQDETLVHLPASLRLEPGMLAYELRASGEIVLRPSSFEARQRAWVEFLDSLDASPSDPDFMKERPMNRVPVDRKLFSDE